MAFGLKIFDDAGVEWFDSTTAFGFIEIDNFSVATDGTTTNSASGTLDAGYTQIFAVYTPADIEDDELSLNTRRPIVTVTTGPPNWQVDQTWAGTNTGTVAMRGGRVLVFAH